MGLVPSKIRTPHTTMQPGLFRNHLGADQSAFVISVIALSSISSLLSLIGTVIVLVHGHLTQYPSSDPHLGFTPGPNTRGTLNLISACASTIFTCVYVSVHLDVPDRLRAIQVSEAWRAHNVLRIPDVILRWFGAIWRWTCTKSFCRRLLWVVFNVEAPELIVVVSVLERISARDGMRAMHSRGQKDWTMTTAFFADMGGFQLEDGHHLRNGREFLEWFDSFRGERGTVVLDVPRIQQEIEDRANADVVLKLFTVVQAAWFFIETVMRLIEHRAVSPLEAATCSYIVCTVTTYFCWLAKPYSVDGRIILRREMFQDAQHPGEGRSQSVANPENPHSTTITNDLPISSGEYSSHSGNNLDPLLIKPLPPQPTANRLRLRPKRTTNYLSLPPSKSKTNCGSFLRRDRLKTSLQF